MRIQSDKFDFDVQPFIKGRTYDRVVVFEVKTGALNKSLFRRSRLFRGETAYKGVIPARALGRMLQIPVTQKLADFVKSWAKDRYTPENGLSSYVGMDLTEHLGARTFDLVWD